jgi:hypothetical protein
MRNSLGLNYKSDFGASDELIIQGSGIWAPRRLDQPGAKV